MYLASLQEKISLALQTSPELVHSEFVKSLDHREQIALLDTVREMQKRKLLKRDISQKTEDGKMILRYLRVG